MIIFLIIKAFQALCFSFVTLIPTVETPLWLANNLPEILTRVASFNYYLPISESVKVVIFIITFVLSYKIFKILLNVFNIDLNS